MVSSMHDLALQRRIIAQSACIHRIDGALVLGEHQRDLIRAARGFAAAAGTRGRLAGCAQIRILHLSGVDAAQRAGPRSQSAAGRRADAAAGAAGLRGDDVAAHDADVARVGGLLLIFGEFVQVDLSRSAARSSMFASNPLFDALMRGSTGTGAPWSTGAFSSGFSGFGGGGGGGGGGGSMTSCTTLSGSESVLSRARCRGRKRQDYRDNCEHDAEIAQNGAEAPLHFLRRRPRQFIAPVVRSQSGGHALAGFAAAI